MELDKIESWIADTLAADPNITVPVYAHIAPADATFPCILVRNIDARDTNGNFADRYLVRTHYIITAVTKTPNTPSTLATLTQAISNAFHQATSADGGITCVRLSPYNQIYNDKQANVTYFERGGVFSINTSC